MSSTSEGGHGNNLKQAFSIDRYGGSNGSHCGKPTGKWRLTGKTPWGAGGKVFKLAFFKEENSLSSATYR